MKNILRDWPKRLRWRALAPELWLLGMLALPGMAGAQPRYDFAYYRATLSGPAELPANDSNAFGFLEITVDKVNNSMRLQLRFEDLSSPGTALHLHCCTAEALMGTASPATLLPSLPRFSGQEGWYYTVLNLDDPATYNPAFVNANGGSVSGARASLLAGMDRNQAYVNVHSERYPDGEMRGFVVMKPVPEPSAWLMLATGLALVAKLARARPS